MLNYMENEIDLLNVGNRDAASRLLQESDSAFDYE